MFTKTTEYALRAVIFIAQQGEQKVSLAAIAEAIQSPPSFTAKIMQQLTGFQGIVGSVRGPGGGFFMSNKARQLPVAAILQAMGEEGIIDKCVLGLRKCTATQPCPLHFDYQPIKEQWLHLFQSKTIASLANEVNAGMTVVNNRKPRAVRAKLSGQQP